METSYPTFLSYTPEMTTLRHSGFVFRPFEESDAFEFSVAILESQSTVGKWMTWAHSRYTASDARNWFEQCTISRADGTGYEFGIFQEASGRLVGGVGLNQFNKANNLCNLGYWVRQSMQRQGAATAAVTVLASYAINSLKITRVEIVVASQNEASIRVALKAGATRECLARNRLVIHGAPSSAYIFSIVPKKTNA